MPGSKPGGSSRPRPRSHRRKRLIPPKGAKMRTGKKKRSEPEPILDFFAETAHLEEGDQSGTPIRTCIVDRERKEKPFLLRFVLSPQGEVAPDVKGKSPGRGVWVTARKQIVDDAVKRRAFQRAFRKQVTVSDSLSLEVERLFKRSALPNGYRFVIKQGCWS